jgi:drug/metabolite transporter (DMT)-like permease
MALLLASIASALYGASDFVGGVASRHTSPLAVSFGSQLVGLVGSLAIIGASAGHARISDLAFGFAAGIVAGLGVACLFRGLALGSMGVVAPVAAAVGAVVPVGAGVLGGERPSGATYIAIVLAVFAVVLVSIESQRRGRGGMQEAVLAGLSFGAYFVLLDLTTTTSGAWPLVTANAGAVIALGLVVVRLGELTRIRTASPAANASPTGRASPIGAGTAAAILATGLCDIGGDVLYLAAVRAELLTLVAIVVALYPATTVVLARTVLGERFSSLQIIGIPLALAAVVLLAVA